MGAASWILTHKTPKRLEGRHVSYSQDYWLVEQVPFCGHKKDQGPIPEIPETRLKDGDKGPEERTVRRMRIGGVLQT